MLNKRLTSALDASENQSAASKIVILLICSIMVLATVWFGMVDAGALGLFCIGVGLLGWLWLFDAWKTGELRFSSNPLQLPILGLIIVGLIQLLPLRLEVLPPDLLLVPASQTLSLDAPSTRLAVVQLAAMLLCFAAALVFINSKKRLQIVATTIIVLGFAMSVIGIIQYFGGDGRALWIRQSAQAVPFASFINRHHFGALMEMTIALPLGLLYTGAVARDKRPLYVFAVLIMGVALVLTSSRGALLSLFGLIFFLTFNILIERRRNIKKLGEESDGQTVLTSRYVFLLGGALILTIFWGVLLLGGDSSLLRSIGATGGTGDISSGRLQFWQSTLLMIRDYPLLGVGMDAFGVAYTRYDLMNGRFRLEQAHNEYLQVWAETGIIGLFLILTFIFLLFRRGWQIFITANDRWRRGAAIGSLAGCFAVIVHSFFDFPLRTPANLIVFLMLAALATVQVNDSKSRHRKNKESADILPAVGSES